jgi:cytochrome c556
MHRMEESMTRIGSSLVHDPVPVRRTRLGLVPLLVAALLPITTAGLASADSHEQDAAYIGYRQSVMSIVGTHMGAISDIMKNGLDVPGAIAGHAEQMAEAAALVGPAFRRPISEGPTDAKPEIWKDWAKFEQAIADYEEAARGLAAAASAEDPSGVGPAMKALGKSCGGCHKPFRKPKEESYKNR